MALPRQRATYVTALIALTAAAWPPAAAARGSANVAALQVALRAQRLYAGSVDGVDGPGTAAAVRRLQRRSRLDVDGIVGPLTRRTLGRRGRPAFGSRVVGPGDRGWDVAALQFLLAWRGFPSAAIDGGFGEHTEAALVRYQRWAGLSADGRAGPATLRSLQLAAPRAPVTLSFPVAAPLGDPFGPRGDRFHSGIDLLSAAGTPVRGAGAGRVTFAGWDPGGYGNLVVIDHGNGVSSWYAHLSRIDITSGAAVTTATQVGLVGATGNATGPHLHFEVRLRGAVTDPLAVLR
jgi:murein DD-endopeptidase MepM/ murein hydrolase activator NlpD